MGVRARWLLRTNEPGIPFFHGEQALAGWKTVIDEVHQAGGFMGGL